MARRSIVGSIKNKRAIGKSEGARSITQLFVLSTIFSTMLLGSTAKPLSPPQHIPAAQLKRKSELAEAIHDLWHSIFDWSFFMLIITPKPTVQTVNEHRQRQSTATISNGSSSRFSRFFTAAGRLFSGIVRGAFAVLWSPFASKSNSQPTLPLTRADVSLEPTTVTASTALNASSTETTVQIPTRAVTPTDRVPKPDASKASPTTARFLATLTDLEAQMNKHQFYDLERELVAMDNQMAQMFDFSWMPRKTVVSLPSSPPESPIAVVLPQAPPPARRDRKTIQILPIICEVSENSPDLLHTPPYDPRRWSIVTFQPLWGPRAQVGTAH